MVSRFRASQLNTGPRGTGCWTRRSGCGVPWRLSPPRGAGCRPEESCRGLRVSRPRRGRRPGRVGCRNCSRLAGLASDLQHDVSPRPRRRPPRPGKRTNRAAATVGGPLSLCTAFLDPLDGAAEHASQHVNLAAAGKAPIERILTFGAERGWRQLRLLSTAGTTYNRDYLAETPGGKQQPMLNVFHRDGDTVRHFWGSELFYAPEDPGQDHRHVGTLEPLWNLYDLTPEGREQTGTSTELLTASQPVSRALSQPASAWLRGRTCSSPLPR